MNALLPILAALALRNPFWPIGYDGTREPISAEPTVAIRAASTNDVETAAAAAAAVEQADDDPETANTRQWAAARAQLRIGGITLVAAPDGSRRQAVTINGRVYGNNDLISVNHDSRRFTWRVEEITEGKTLKLVRVRVRDLDGEAKGIQL